MSTLPDHLRHAKHVGKPHPGCAVCCAKHPGFYWGACGNMERELQDEQAERSATVMQSDLKRVFGNAPKPLTVSTEGVPWSGAGRLDVGYDERVGPPPAGTGW